MSEPFEIKTGRHPFLTLLRFLGIVVAMIFLGIIIAGVCSIFIESDERTELEKTMAEQIDNIDIRYRKYLRRLYSDRRRNNHDLCQLGLMGRRDKRSD